MMHELLRRTGGAVVANAIIRAGVLVVCGLGGCATIGLQTDALEGRWSGTVNARDAACGGPGHRGLMRVGEGSFAFDPFGSTTILRGKVEGRTLRGELKRPGGNHQTLSITFDGQARSGPAGSTVIDGVLTSARCIWDVRLTQE